MPALWNLIFKARVRRIPIAFLSTKSDFQA